MGSQRVDMTGQLSTHPPTPSPEEPWSTVLGEGCCHLPKTHLAGRKPGDWGCVFTTDKPQGATILAGNFTEQECSVTLAADSGG